MTMKISTFYRMTSLKRPEYIRISIKDILDKNINEYQLRKIVDEKGSNHIQTNQSMYGLLQAGLLANEIPKKRLKNRGYRQSKLVPQFWTHNWRPVQFTLIVDNFGVKYVGEDHAIHLKNVIEENYTVTKEWDR